MKINIDDQHIWVATQPADFRKSIDGLCQIVVDNFKSNPGKGVYIFYNRNRNRLKLLAWHVSGFILLYKRLEKSRFPFSFSNKMKKISINAQKLNWLLAGLDWQLLSDHNSHFDDYF